MFKNIHCEERMTKKTKVGGKMWEITKNKEREKKKKALTGSRRKK